MVDQNPVQIEDNCSGSQRAAGFHVVNLRPPQWDRLTRDSPIDVSPKGRVYRCVAVEAFDPARNAWTELPSLPVSRHGLAGGIIGTRFYVVGGDVQSSGTGVHVSTAENDAFDLSALDK